jgi:hypothetical protein
MKVNSLIKIGLTVCLITVAVALTPIKAYACDDWSLSCVFFGSTPKEIADRDAQRRENEAVTQADKDKRVAEINSAADVAKKQADVMIEAQKQQGQLSVEQAKQAGLNAREQIDALANIKIAEVLGTAAQNVATINGAAQIGTQSVIEAGMTTRERQQQETTKQLINIVGGLFLVGLLGLIVLVGLIVIKRWQKQNFIREALRNVKQPFYTYHRNERGEYEQPAHITKYRDEDR